MDRVYFTGDLDPQSCDMRVVRIEQPVVENVASLRIDVHYLDYDPANADPTLTTFHGPRDDASEQGDGK